MTIAHIDVLLSSNIYSIVFISVHSSALLQFLLQSRAVRHSAPIPPHTHTLIPTYARSSVSVDSVPCQHVSINTRIQAFTSYREAAPPYREQCSCTPRIEHLYAPELGVAIGLSRLGGVARLGATALPSGTEYRTIGTP